MFCTLAGQDADCMAGRLELDLVAGLDAELLGDALGQRDLQFAGDFCHIPYFSKDDFLVK